MCSVIATTNGEMIETMTSLEVQLEVDGQIVGRIISTVTTTLVHLTREVVVSPLVHLVAVEVVMATTAVQVVVSVEVVIKGTVVVEVIAVDTLKTGVVVVQDLILEDLVVNMVEIIKGSNPGHITAIIMTLHLSMSRDFHNNHHPLLPPPLLILSTLAAFGMLNMSTLTHFRQLIRLLIHMLR